MPCCKVSVNKNFKCDKDNCLCIPTEGKSCVCLCQKKTGGVTQRGGKCECTKCTCVKTAGFTCICICKDDGGKIKACEDCSCGCAEEAGQSCKGKARETCICTGQCKCDDAKCVCLNTGGATCICVCTDEKGNIKACGDCSCIPSQGAKTSFKERKAVEKSCGCIGKPSSCICVCSDQGKLVCCDDCKCDDANKCDKKGCTCVVKGSDSKQTLKICNCKPETLKGDCCDDCKCDENNTCGKKGCACSKPDNVKAGVAEKACVCVKDGTSCLCNEKEKLICCENCKCVYVKCDKEGCVCVTRESNSNQAFKAAKSCQCKSASCVCVCEGKDDIVCCDGCKCDENNICGKKGCACICEKVENICKECKCDEINKCGKDGCICVPKM